MSMLCGYFNFNLLAFARKLTLQSYSRGKGTRVVSRHNWDWTPTNSETSVTFRSSGEAGFPLPDGKYCNRHEHKAACMQSAERSCPAILSAIHLCVSSYRGGVTRTSLPLNHERGSGVHWGFDPGCARSTGDTGCDPKITFYLLCGPSCCCAVPKSSGW